VEKALASTISDFDVTVDSKKLTNDSSQAIIMVALREGSSTKHSKLDTVEYYSSRKMHDDACIYSESTGSNNIGINNNKREGAAVKFDVTWPSL
jgi:hypothetical protein